MKNDSEQHELASMYVQHHPRYVEVYGFVSWIVSYVLYAVWLAWAFVPDNILHSFGIYYYPAKYWAIAIPCWCIVAFLFSLVTYWSINLIISEPLDSFKTISMAEEKEISENKNPEAISPIFDLPLSALNLMYPENNEKL